MVNLDLVERNAFTLEGIPDVTRIILGLENKSRNACITASRALEAHKDVANHCRLQSVTLKRHTFTGAVAGKRRGVDCGRAVSVIIT